MFISAFRLTLVILSSMVAGLNIFNIMSAKANGEPTQMPILTLVGMLVIIASMIVTQHLQNKATKREDKN